MKRAALFACSLALLTSWLMAGCGGSPALPGSPAPTTRTNGCFALNLTGSSRTEVVNGTACTTTNPSVVAVYRYDASGVYLGSCSGTVIGARAVLTAAHCFAGVSVVRLPSAGGGFMANISTSLNIGPDTFDVAIAITDQDIGRRPFPVLTSRAATVGEQAVLAGWGEDENNGIMVLKAGTATISFVSSDTIVTLYTGSGTSGMCPGDSGGPILLSQGGTWTVAGVARGGYGGGYGVTSCPSLNARSIFTAMSQPDVQSFVTGLVPDIQQK